MATICRICQQPIDACRAADLPNPDVCWDCATSGAVPPESRPSSQPPAASWRVERRFHLDNGNDYYVVAADGRVVAAGLSKEWASLIAAAPETADMLRYFVETASRLHAYTSVTGRAKITEARALLARIDGERGA